MQNPSLKKMGKRIMGKHIIVIGGGIIGLSSAHYLQRQGHAVTVLDKGDLTDNCSYGNCGYVCPSHFIPLATPGIVRQGLKWMLNSRSPFYVQPRLSRSLIDWGWKFMKSANAAHVKRSARPLRDIALLSQHEYESWMQIPGLEFSYEHKGLLEIFQTEAAAEHAHHTVKAAQELGYHPFPQPSGNLSQAYTNPLGVRLGPCTYCGFCEWFGCGNYSKASPQTTLLPALKRKTNFEARALCNVVRINLDSAGKRATGVTYVDSSGKEWDQPADLVLLCAFQLFNVHLLLLSGIGTPYDPRSGQGVIGRNFSYQVTSSVDAFFDKGFNFNPFVASGAIGMCIDEFNGDNFDHGKLGFVGGGYIGAVQTNGRPILGTRVPKGTRAGARPGNGQSPRITCPAMKRRRTGADTATATASSIWTPPTRTHTATSSCA